MTSSATNLSQVDLDVLQGCREIGRVVRVSRQSKLVEVEVQTQDNKHLLQYDLVKLPMDFVPWPGTVMTRYLSTTFLNILMMKLGFNLNF